MDLEREKQYKFEAGAESRVMPPGGNAKDDHVRNRLRGCTTTTCHASQDRRFCFSKEDVQDTFRPDRQHAGITQGDGDTKIIGIYVY